MFAFPSPPNGTWVNHDEGLGKNIKFDTDPAIYNGLLWEKLMLMQCQSTLKTLGCSYDLTDKVQGPVDSFTPQNAAWTVNTLYGMRYG